MKSPSAFDSDTDASPSSPSRRHAHPGCSRQPEARGLDELLSLRGLQVRHDTLRIHLAGRHICRLLTRFTQRLHRDRRRRARPVNSPTGMSWRFHRDTTTKPQKSLSLCTALPSRSDRGPDPRWLFSAQLKDSISEERALPDPINSNPSAMRGWVKFGSSARLAGAVGTLAGSRVGFRAFSSSSTR